MARKNNKRSRYTQCATGKNLRTFLYDQKGRNRPGTSSFSAPAEAVDDLGDGFPGDGIPPVMGELVGGTGASGARKRWRKARHSQDLGP